MKRPLAIISFLLLFLTVAMERGGVSWILERPLVHALGAKVHRSLPQVTAVILPLKKGTLVAQDVALAVRAMVSFRPRLILVEAPLGDLSSGPLSLIREAREEGAVQGIPFAFGSLPLQAARETYQAADLFFLLGEPTLTGVIGGVSPTGLLGFILPHEKEEKITSLPLFGKNSEGVVIGSLWWRGLTDSIKKEESMPSSFLIGGHMLFFSNNNAIWLGREASLFARRARAAAKVSLEDFLLRREELERGEIRPDLEGLFRDKTVVIGGSEAADEASILQDAQQQLAVRHLNAALYGLFLLLLTLIAMVIIRLSGMDLMLLLFFSFCLYAGSVFLAFYFFGILLPLLLPVTIALIAFLKKERTS